MVPDAESRFDCVVVGAGIVGLAVARALASRGLEVLVLERHALPAQETSARNSGVIHAGLYYPTGSLKATLCVEGRRRLYAYCEARHVPVRRCGKILVAQEGQLGQLEQIHRKAIANGVESVERLTASEVAKLEPEVRCAAGLLSAETGIVDVHELAYAYLADLESAGGLVQYEAVVSDVDLAGRDIRVAVQSHGETLSIGCAMLVNSAGLDAVDLLRRMRGYPEALHRASWFAKGCYFVASGARPFQRLVYPMPNEAGLGVHATIDMEGAVRFGPNVRWVDRPEYQVDEADAAEFYESIRSYWPGMPEGCLQPGYAGVRPKLTGPGTPAHDFVIEDARTHGRQGLVNLLGIESPGLTSSLAIADRVAEALLAKHGAVTS